MRNAAIILSAGKGTRMGSHISKQYIDVLEKPVIYYTIKAFEESEVDAIFLVISEEDRDYVEKHIINLYGLSKIKQIVYGGKERYHSVYNALKCIGTADNVLIHDGARPLITAEQINMLIKEMQTCNACVGGMPVKDTIKVVDDDNYVESTPERSKMWQVQTPQVFRYPEIVTAYEELMKAEEQNVTDDAMVMESFGNNKVKLVELSYENIKVTTKEDLVFMQGILMDRASTAACRD